MFYKMSLPKLATVLSAAMLLCGMASPSTSAPLMAFATSPLAAAPLLHQDARPIGEIDKEGEVTRDLQRQVVEYPTNFAAGTVIIDTAQTYLYYVLGEGKAMRYGIGVGRDGFTWSGVQAVTRKAEWPDWTPPQEMIERQPYLPRWMAGGESNPLGARAIYLGNTVYRIHGTNMPATIGKKVSSGCIRMLNADIADLYDRVDVGARIVVLANPNYIAMASKQSDKLN
jgi:lipoprotein-anchoring transpeptidase ErfK/SrfK